MLVTSKQNEKIKKYASLKQKKYRNEYGLFLVEGIKMVREAFKYGQKIVAVIGVSELVGEFFDSGVEIIETTKEVVDFVCDAVTPQGVVAVLEIPKTAKKKPSGTCVCLDRVADAGNEGTIFRILASVGVSDVYLINCADAYSPKCVRSSMSGIFLVNPQEVSSEEFVELIGDMPCITADMGGENVFDIDFSGDFCLIMGSEAHGVANQLKQLSSKTLAIPMKQQMESLNVGVSCGIILYQLLNKKLR